MKKIIIPMLLLFALASCDNQTFTEQLEETAEIEITSNFNLQTLEKKDNLGEILSFLDVKSIEDIDFEEYKYDGDIDSKGENTKLFVSLSGSNCVSKSEPEDRYAILEINSENKNAFLISTIKKDSSNELITITQYDDNEKAYADILIEYDTNNEFTKIAWIDFNQKGCWNDCMKSELGAIEKNAVKQVLFIVGLPESLLGLYAVCGWECL